MHHLAQPPFLDTPSSFCLDLAILSWMHIKISDLLVQPRDCTTFGGLLSKQRTWEPISPIEHYLLLIVQLCDGGISMSQAPNGTYPGNSG